MLVPDVARGLALLGIALANAPTAWFPTHPGSPGSHFGGVESTADKAVVVFTAITTHVRGLPMFSTLLGFGIGLIVMSLWRRGFPLPTTRRVLLRRYGFLALFGALHLIFLFFGDIMLIYGASGMLIAAIFTWRDKTLLRLSYGLLAFNCLLGILGATGVAALGGVAPGVVSLGSGDGSGSFLPQSYPELLLLNSVLLMGHLLTLPMYWLQYLPLMLIGFVWARRGVLADVPSHRRELGIWTAIGATVAIGLGLPWGLSTIGVLPTAWASALSTANTFLGALTGPGILAFLALVLNGVQQRVWNGASVPVLLRIPAALGKRSMSGYLMQSVLFSIVAQPFLLGWNPPAAAQAGLALGIWVLTLVGACLLEWAGKPGPFEYLHRRLSYGPTMRPQLANSSGVFQGVDKQVGPHGGGGSLPGGQSGSH
ncbi:DUF418 domain-containing protein [Corynebacterium lizhenjunii]|uniref:DUF418 domain-containing protein n=2 Tax=Corynebacterium lizhenjunii TaxID=2709394 RepID=A0A7T0KG94_9CORY|nr:DUF418 domain-containing protein [Corynebacterium lizhenjunii]